MIFKERIQEAQLDDNLKHAKYLSNLMIIEHQQKIHRSIKHHTHNNKSSGIKLLRFQLMKQSTGIVYLHHYPETNRER